MSDDRVAKVREAKAVLAQAAAKAARRPPPPSLVDLEDERPRRAPVRPEFCGAEDHSKCGA